MKLATSISFLLAAGCTVMVNGKPKKLGGGGDPTPATQTAAAPPPAAGTAPAPAAPPAPAQPAVRPGQQIAVPAVLNSKPHVTRIEGIVFDSTFRKVHGDGNSPDCGQYMPSQPIASIVIDKPVAAMELVVAGGTGDGFVLRRDKALWFACTHSIGQLPTISKLSEGWQPGRYDIYPIARYAKEPKAFTIELYDPATPAPWSDGIKTVTITGKLATPMFVELATKPNRRRLRAEHAGYGCDKVALPDEPDLALVLERPVPGLIVRPMPTTTAVTLRRELRGDKQARKGCPKFERRVVPHDYSPSYETEHELHFGRDDEGTFGISLGTADDRNLPVTLMIYDESTKLDPLAAFPYGGDTGALERRWLGLYFPQLDVRELTALRDHARAELAAKLFAQAPKPIFVYSKLDLDKDIASGSTDTYPKKDEPLLVLSLDQTRAEVLAADGMRYHVKLTHLLLAPSAEPAVLTAPRPLRKLDINGVIALLPPSAKALATAREKRLDAHEKCVDRVWAPYGRQLPTITRPSGVDVVYYESARTKNIRRAGEAAVDRTCGTDEKLAKLTEAERVKMLAEVEKARVKLLATATANWKP
jgi:hypothetical protein